MSQREREWLENFLERADITYTTPGRRDTVYVGMDHGKRQYRQKRCLLWKIRDLLGIAIASEVITNKQYASFPETFQHDVSFCQLYEFLKGHKQLPWNDRIPHSSCLCKLCENTILLAKRINSSLRSKILATSVHDVVETNACDSRQDFIWSESVSSAWHQIYHYQILMKKKKQYHFWIGNGQTKILEKSTKVFLLISLLRNGILLY